MTVEWIFVAILPNCVSLFQCSHQSLLISSWYCLLPLFLFWTLPVSQNFCTSDNCVSCMKRSLYGDKNGSIIFVLCSTECCPEATMSGISTQKKCFSYTSPENKNKTLNLKKIGEHFILVN